MSWFVVVVVKDKKKYKKKQVVKESRVEWRKKGEKILERMITNFKSDYGNLLLSGRRTTELNIPQQMKNITMMKRRSGMRFISVEAVDFCIMKMEKMKAMRF
jgi:hypothetical protein